VSTTSRDRYDTIVAGAGPAGVLAALHAAKRGNVLVVDASILPREKSCGGMIHALTRDALAPYGSLPEGICLTPRTVHFRYVDWDRGIRKPTTLAFLNVDRAGFDDWLISLLPPAVEVVGGCRVVSLTQDEYGVDLTCKTSDETFALRSENVVGADGARSAVRRALRAGTTHTYVTLQDYVDLDGEIPPYFDCLHMRGIGEGLGYAYVVPKGDRAIVGSVFYPRTKHPWESQDRVLDTLRAAMPQLGESRKRESCAALCLRAKESIMPGRGRVLLAGEAGGFMSPTSGEGISYAVRSGIEAGRAIGGHAPDEALDAYALATSGLRADIARRLRWLPFMESPVGKYVAGLTPSAIVSRITEGL
jgi:flavin-dependent dehydrogenase